MAKKFKAIVRLQLQAGKANPAPPVGPALAGHGINIMAFCKEYNARTSNRQGEVLPAKIGKVTRSQVKEIAEQKMKDLNAIDLDGAIKQIEGTARSMGIVVTD